MTNTTLRWGEAAAPVAPREDHDIHQLGRQRNDPYAWMKYVPPCGTRTLENLPRRLGDHLKAEMAYAQRVLQPLAAAAQGFQDRMMQRLAPVDEPPSVSPKGWQYQRTRAAGSAQRVFSRTDAQGRVQRLFDEADRARGHAYYRATDHQFSPDERYFAWAEDLIGNDRHQICVLDMDTGHLRTLVPADAYGYGGLIFSASSRDLFWIWRDARSRPTRLYRSSLAGGDPVLVYEEHDPALFMRIGRTAAGHFITLTLSGPDTSEVYLIGAQGEAAALRRVRPRRRGVRYEVDEWEGGLLMLTNEDAADRRIVCLDPTDFSFQRELVGHRPGIPILSMHPFARALVVLERQDGNRRLVLHPPGGRPLPVPFDDPLYCVDVAPAQPYTARHVRVVYQTPAVPPRWVDVALASGARRRVGETRLHHFDPNDYRVERLQARAPDGETVPITVLSRKTLAPGTPAPLLLTGYGAYGFTSEPLFSLSATVLADSGFRYAIAHVRGGSEKGFRWYQGGCRADKHHSLTDFVACAQALLATGYAAPGKIVARGVSAGGLLVCGAMNRAPELWAGVIAQVPFVDMLNTLSDADHPLVPLLSPDWGDPLTDPEAYDYIARVSPYENVHSADYPPLLCTAGLKDDRVAYWEPAKLLAAIRRNSTCRNPAMLLLNPDSGHQGSDDRQQEFAQEGLFWAFAHHCVDPLSPGSTAPARGADPGPD